MADVEPAGWPRDPVSAVTHANPYDYYSNLVATRPLYRDEALASWVASSAETVAAVLTHPASRVRPAAEPVPGALLGSPAGRIVRHLVRTTDGAGQRTLKDAVVTAFDSIDPRGLATTASRCAARLARDLGPGSEASCLVEFVSALPAHVVGALIGLPVDRQEEVARLVADLARCLFAGGTPNQIEAGMRAAGPLLEILARQVASASGTTAEPSPLRNFLARGRALGCEEAIVANAIGLLAQAQEATTALIGTTLLTLARHSQLLARVRSSPETLLPVIAEVLRWDSPVQNTRRFLAEDATIAGRRLKGGDAALLILAAANRDPEANPQPDVFDPSRESPRVFTFGLGAHACPGRAVAVSITRAAVAQLLAKGIDLQRLNIGAGFRPSVNCRTPLLEWAHVSVPATRRRHG